MPGQPHTHFLTSSSTLSMSLFAPRTRPAVCRHQLSSHFELCQPADLSVDFLSRGDGVQTRVVELAAFVFEKDEGGGQSALGQ